MGIFGYFSVCNLRLNSTLVRVHSIKFSSFWKLLRLSLWLNICHFWQILHVCLKSACVVFFFFSLWCTVLYKPISSSLLICYSDCLYHSWFCFTLIFGLLVLFITEIIVLKSPTIILDFSSLLLFVNFCFICVPISLGYNTSLSLVMLLP